MNFAVKFVATICFGRPEHKVEEDEKEEEEEEEEEEESICCIRIKSSFCFLKGFTPGTGTRGLLCIKARRTTRVGKKQEEAAAEIAE